MQSKFGILSKLNFLQDIASLVIAKINPAIIHNIEKYYALKKVHYLSAIEHTQGDYLEFGVFTGSSFCHSIRCCKKLLHINSKLTSTKFYGFDSFSGFGDLSKDDQHPFYKDENFETNIKDVEKRISKTIGKNFSYKLIPGYYDISLKKGAGYFGIKYARIVFIDCDTYASANDALLFCSPIIQNGTFIILDDFFSYKGSIHHGVAKAFTEFITLNNLEVRKVFTYGMGGVVYVISGTSK